MHINISYEFLLCLVVEILTAGICIGIFKCTIKFMEKQIEELKGEMKKFASYIERIVRVEASVKTVFKRLDEIRGKKYDI